jgi:hypothetical protein
MLQPLPRNKCLFGEFSRTGFSLSAFQRQRESKPDRLKPVPLSLRHNRENFTGIDGLAFARQLFDCA